uniref:Uncharacterized protein n=1 Tax=Human herpesvirus 2 TaxID=10310 RepID=A0A481TMX6_HHV2|nr:hypothetical protein [Human alphaherpesvirus 2]
MVRQTRQGRSSAKVSTDAAAKGPVSKSPSAVGSAGGPRADPGPRPPEASRAAPRGRGGAGATSLSTSSSSALAGGTPTT